MKITLTILFKLSLGLMIGFLASCAEDAAEPVGDTQTENQAPSINNQNFTVPENSANGTAVGTVSATDPDNDALSYSLLNGNTSDAFALSSSGALSVANMSALDFESNASFNLSVSVSDGDLDATATITVNLTDVDDTGSANACKTLTLTYDDEVLEWTYNNEGQVSSIISSYVNDNGVTETEGYDYSYTNGKLTGAVEDEEQVELTYQADLLDKIIRNNIQDGDIDEDRFFYINDQLVRIENWNNYSGATAGTFVLYDTKFFSFSNGNVTQVEEEEEGEIERGIETYSYDDKSNPFHMDLATYLLFGREYWYYSQNNAAQIVQTYTAGTLGYTETISYIYNSNGYPTTTNFSYVDAEDPNDTYSETYSLEYNCND